MTEDVFTQVKAEQVESPSSKLMVFMMDGRFAPSSYAKVADIPIKRRFIPSVAELQLFGTCRTMANAVLT
jgi:hypothetical protein